MKTSIREVVWIVVALICCAQLARSESPFLDSAGRPLVKPELLDSSGKLIVAKQQAKSQQGCPCGCAGPDCTCSNCPRDEQLYGTARRVAVAQQLPLLVWVGHEDPKTEKEVGAAINLHVASFQGDRTKRIVAFYHRDGNIWGVPGDNVFLPGVSAEQLRAAIQPPDTDRVRQPARIVPPAAPPVRFNQSPPGGQTYRQNTILGGSAGIRNARCST